MKPEQIEWENSEAQKYLDEQGGSKSGAHAFLFDNHPELRRHLPTDTHYIAPGEDVEKVLSQINFDNPKIVRGCHPLDVTGMVDVIPTSIGYNIRSTRMVIESIFRSAQEKEVRDYVGYESGNPFDGNIGLLIQDYNRGDRGTVIEHPHRRGAYRISVNRLPDAEGYPRTSEKMYAEDGSTLRQYSYYDDSNERKPSSLDDLEELPPPEDLDSGALSSEEAKKVIGLYRKIVATGLMPASHSYQMEFGIKQNEILFYQSRVFRPFQTASDLDIDALQMSFAGRKHKKTLTYDTFGITPAEGWELNLAELNDEFIARYADEKHMAYAYNNFAHKQTAPLSARPENLMVYMPYQHLNVLGHGHFRWMQKAPVSLIGARRGLINDDGEDMFRRPGINEKIRIRVYSNGLQGLAVVVE
jgi:hypothetical protein